MAEGLTSVYNSESRVTKLIFLTYRYVGEGNVFLVLELQSWFERGGEGKKNLSLTEIKQRVIGQSVK